MDKEKLIKANYHGELDLNGFILSCAVLKDGTRVFSERSLANAFGIKGGGAYWKKKREAKDDSAFLPEYLSANYLNPFIPNDLINKFNSAYNYLAVSGMESTGVEVTVLPEICDVYIQAEKSGIKNENVKLASEVAYKMIKAFAKVGIIALVDEATGYQYEREAKELQVILKALVSDEILEYQQQFQLSFYREIFRLWNIPFTAQYIKRKPQFIGHLTNKFVYSNLPKGMFVLEKLKSKTPKTQGGNYRYRLHQSLTEDKGREALKKVLYSVEALASVSKNKLQFERLINDKYGQKEIRFPGLDILDEEYPKKNERKLSKFNQKLVRALEYDEKKL